MPARSLSDPEESFLRSFFQQTTDAGLHWLMMRNYEGFPRHIGNDIDVFFPRAQYQSAAALFRRVLASHGGEILHRHQRDYVMALWFRLPEGLPIHIDFYHGVTTWHGLYYLSEGELWDQRICIDDIPVPRPAHEAMNLLVTSIIWGGFYKDRYATRIGTLLKDPVERGIFDDCMSRAFGDSAVPPFDPTISTAQPERDQLWGQALRDSLRRTSYRRSPLWSGWHQTRYWLGELRTLAHPPAPCIVVMDADKPSVASGFDSFVGEASHLFGAIAMVEYDVALRSWKSWFRKVLIPRAKDSLVIIRFPNGCILPGWLQSRANEIFKIPNNGDWCDTALTRVLAFTRMRS